jgi:glycosyltransferase involved in cell wall biosynthesis
MLPLEKVQQDKVRVCHITAHPVSDVRVFYRECCSLAKADYEVYLVVPCRESGLKDGVYVHAYPRAKNRIVRKLFMPWIALWLALKTRSAIYHYHDPEFMFIGFVLKWVFGKKVVLDIHESYAKQIMSKYWLPKWSRKLVVIFYKFLEKTFTYGQALILANLGSVPDYPPSAYLVRNYPLPDEKLIAKVDRRPKISDVPLLIYIGGIAVIRGADVYVELASKLAEHGYNFRMMIIGQDHENCVEKLNLKIKELNLQDKVSFSGHMKYSEVMELVAQATIGLCLFLPLPHNTASLSTKILEYMMMGVPVLASNFDGWRDFVEREKSGRMVDPCNIDQVVNVCEQMLADGDELVAMGQRGIAAVRNKYNWSSEFKVLLKCYDDLLKQ